MSAKEELIQLILEQPHITDLVECLVSAILEGRPLDLKAETPSE